MAQTKKYFSVVEAAAIIVAQIVGIGIFFKNGSIFSWNGNNPWGIIISWLIGAFLSFCACVSLSKLASINQKPYPKKGIGQWLTTISTKKFGDFSYLFMNLVYYPGIFLIIAIFAIEPICSCFGYTLPFYVVCLISLGVVLLVITLNFLCNDICRINPILGYMKFLPLLLCLIATILVVSLGKIDDLLYHNLFKTNNTAPSFTGILKSLPAVIFAYNGYHVVGIITEQIKNPEKKINKIVIIGICAVAFIYVAVAILMIINGASNGKILNIFGTNAGLKVMSFVLFFIAMCSVLLYGSVTYSSMDATIKDNLIVGHKYLNGLNNKKNGLGTFLAVIVVLLGYFIIFVIPSIIFNSDSPLDTITNAISYSCLIILLIGFFIMIIKKYKRQISDRFTIFQYVIIWVAIIALTSVLTYSYILSPILDGVNHKLSTKSSSGVFYGGDGIIILVDWLVIITATLLSGLVPFLNLYIINKRK